MQNAKQKLQAKIKVAKSKIVVLQKEVKKLETEISNLCKKVVVKKEVKKPVKKIMKKDVKKVEEVKLPKTFGKMR